MITTVLHGLSCFLQSLIHLRFLSHFLPWSLLSSILRCKPFVLIMAPNSLDSLFNLTLLPMAFLINVFMPTPLNKMGWWNANIDIYLTLPELFLFKPTFLTFFWDHALLMATHLINRLPSSVLNWKCPYEVLFNRPPHFASLCCFGCLCYTGFLVRF